MIPMWFTIWILSALTWLGYESNWMRVRLPVGVSHKASTIDNWFTQFSVFLHGYDANNPHPLIKFTPNTNPVKLYCHRNSIGSCYISRSDSSIYGTCPNNGNLLLSPGIVEPICGWDWLLKREHPQVDYQITIQAWGCKSTIRLNPNADKGNIVKNVCTIALKPSKEQRQLIRATNKKIKNKREELCRSKD